MEKAFKMTNSFDIEAGNVDGAIGTLFAVLGFDEDDLSSSDLDFYTAADEESLGKYLLENEERDENCFVIHKVGTKST